MGKTLSEECMSDEWIETHDFPVSTIATGALVCRDDGKVLLIRSQRRGWEFPGGVVERGERIIDGLKREVFEESGIVCEPVSFVGLYQNKALRQGYGPLEGVTLPSSLQLDFVCRYVSGEPTVSDESLEVAWFDPDDARAAVHYPGVPERLNNMLDHTTGMMIASYEKPGADMTDYEQIFLS